MFSRAITRKPGPDFAAGETSAGSGDPHYDLVCRQHERYVNVLSDLGLEVIELEPLETHPDAYFVEDPAIVTPAVAIVTIPGAPSRRGEQNTLAEALRPYRKLAWIRQPGTVDGGDVLMVGSHFFVGLSDRTNEEGARQLGRIFEEYDYTWSTIPVAGGLHLKSEVNYIGNNTLLVTQRFSSNRAFEEFDRIVLLPEESYAANTLLINDCLITPTGFPDSRTKLEHTGLDIVELDMSEVRKMDGGLTCLSLRF